MVGGTILYALTSIFGYQAWKIEMPLGFTLGSTFEFCLYLGSMGMSVPVAIRNFYKSYRDGTGKMRPFMEAVRPLGTIHILRISTCRGEWVRAMLILALKVSRNYPYGLGGGGPKSEKICLRNI